jgi:predicted nuclease with TOPRIM domain
MTGLSPGRALRVQRLEQAQEALSAKDRELEQTQEALRKQLGENAELSRRFVELQQLVESYKAREAANRPLHDVIEETVKQLKGQS